MAVKWIKDRPYYYTYTREDGRILTEYWGPAINYDIRLIIALDRAIREKRAEARRAEDEAIRRVVAEDRPLATWCTMVEMVCRATLEACGFHRQGRHRWRKKRMSKALETAAQGPPPAKRYTHAEVQEIANRAQAGDTKAAAEFEALLKDPEWRRPLLDCVGSSARWLNDRLIDQFAGPKGLAVQAAMRQRHEEIRRNVTPADAHPLEGLLASRVATCWLALCLAEYRANGGSHAPRVEEALQRAVDRAHRRLLSSIRALADFRRLDATVVLAAGPARGGLSMEASTMPQDGSTQPRR